jgi:uncharacterized membrane protein
MRDWNWDFPGILLFIFFALTVLIVYFLPTVIAAFRRHPYVLAIFLIDLLLGWTFIGWLGALVWAFISPGVSIFPQHDALEIARLRYARGEITSAEFEEIKRNLT